MTRNLGSSSTYCMGTQNDFLYMPALFAEDWARVATQMTDVGLPFTYAFYTAIYGIARMEDMSILRSVYLEPNQRADFILRSEYFMYHNYGRWGWEEARAIVLPVQMRVCEQYMPTG